MNSLPKQPVNQYLQKRKTTVTQNFLLKVRLFRTVMELCKMFPTVSVPQNFSKLTKILNRFPSSSFQEKLSIIIPLQRWNKTEQNDAKLRILINISRNRITMLRKPCIMFLGILKVKHKCFQVDLSTHMVMYLSWILRWIRQCSRSVYNFVTVILNSWVYHYM